MDPSRASSAGYNPAMVQPTDPDYLRLLWRGSLRADALLSLDEAAAALPGPPQANERWISEVVEPAGRVPSGPVYRWSDVVAAVAAPSADRPVTRWRDAARHLGVSDDTLARRRRELDPDRRCYFASVVELHRWWRELLEPRREPSPAPKRPRPRVRTRAGDDEPVDWSALARELTSER